MKVMESATKESTQKSKLCDMVEYDSTHKLYMAKYSTQIVYG